VARYGISFTKTTGAAAGLLAQLRTGTARDLRIYEIGVFAATAVASQVALTRPTAVGSGFTSTSTGAAEDPISAAGVAVVDTAASTAPTITTSYLRLAQIPATIGAGIVWTFPNGLVVPTSGGMVLQQLSTAAVTYAVYLSYDE